MNIVMIVVFTIQFFDWSQVPYLALIFFTGFGIIFYPLLIGILSSRISFSEEDTKNSSDLGRTFGIAMGFLISRVLFIISQLLIFSTPFIIPTIAGIAVIVFLVLISKDSQALFSKYSTLYDQSPNSFVNLLFIGIIFAMKAEFLTIWTSTPSFLSILTDIILHLSFLAFIVILHMFFDANKIRGGIWWCVLSILLILTSTSQLWFGWRYYFLEFLAINLFFSLFENTPKQKSSLIPRKLLGFVNWFCLLGAMVFLCGGQFLFPESFIDYRIKVSMFLVVGICAIIAMVLKSKKCNSSEKSIKPNSNPSESLVEENSDTDIENSLELNDSQEKIQEDEASEEDGENQ